MSRQTEYRRPQRADDSAVSRDSVDAPIDVNELLERCLGNVQLALRVVDKFQRQFDNDLGELVEAAFDADDARVTQVAHRIKGSAGSVAAGELRRIAAEIERRARDSDLSSLPDQIRTLESEWSRFVTHAARLGRDSLSGTGREST